MKSKHTFYCCLFENGYNYIVEVDEWDSNNNPIGHIHAICYKNNNEGSVQFENWRSSYDWAAEGYIIREATLIEKEWLLNCVKAQRLVDKPKEVIMFPIY